MEEWDPANNDFVLRCIAAGEQISMPKLSVPDGKILLWKMFEYLENWVSKIVPVPVFPILFLF